MKQSRFICQYIIKCKLCYIYYTIFRILFQNELVLKPQLMWFKVQGQNFIRHLNELSLLTSQSFKTHFLCHSFFPKLVLKQPQPGQACAVLLLLHLKSWEKDYRSVPHSARHVPDILKVSKNLSCLLMETNQTGLLHKKKSSYSLLFSNRLQRETDKKKNSEQ